MASFYVSRSKNQKRKEVEDHVESNQEVHESGMDGND